MESWVIVVVAVVGLPMLVGIVAIVLEHREKMAAIRKNKDAAKGELDQLSSEYQEFVLGIDSRMQKMEERIRLLETRLRQSGDSGENQQVRRG